MYYWLQHESLFISASKFIENNAGDTREDAAKINAMKNGETS